MPCRSEAPLVEIRKPAPARCPTTVGPGPAGRGVDGDADGLVDHDDRVVVVDDLDPLDDLGDDRERVDLDRDRHVEDRAGQHPVALAGDGDAVEQRRGRCGDQVGGAGARQPEQPGHRGVDALAGEAVGHGEHPVVGPTAHSAGSRAARACVARARVPSIRTPR